MALEALPGGEIASQEALQYLENKLFENPQRIRSEGQLLLNEVNQDLAAYAERMDFDQGMGTTLTALSLDFENGRGYIAHVGDSSAFLYRSNALYRLSVEHTMEEYLKSTVPTGGDLIIPESEQHSLVQCVGQGADVNAFTYDFSLVPGDRIIVCSDGITKTLSNSDIAYFCYYGDNAEKLTHDLINFANERGGPDNATVVSVFISE